MNRNYITDNCINIHFLFNGLEWQNCFALIQPWIMKYHSIHTPVGQQSSSKSDAITHSQSFTRVPLFYLAEWHGSSGQIQCFWKVRAHPSISELKYSKKFRAHPECFAVAINIVSSWNCVYLVYQRPSSSGVKWGWVSFLTVTCKRNLLAFCQFTGPRRRNESWSSADPPNKTMNGPKNYFKRIT